MSHLCGSRDEPLAAHGARAGIAALTDLPVLPDALIGVGIGAVVAKLLIWRLERRGTELTSRRTRQIEAVWIGVALLTTLVVSFAVEVL